MTNAYLANITIKPISEPNLDVNGHVAAIISLAAYNKNAIDIFAPNDFYDNYYIANLQRKFDLNQISK